MRHFPYPLAQPPIQGRADEPRIARLPLRRTLFTVALTVATLAPAAAANAGVILNHNESLLLDD